MEAFGGIYSRKNGGRTKELVSMMFSRLTKEASMDQYVFSHSRFTFSAAFSKRSFSPKIIETQRFFLFISGRIDQGSFDADVENINESWDTLLTLELDSILSNLRGDFIVILYDKFIENLVCIRDQIGTRSCYYQESSDYLCIASEIAAFRSLPFVSFQMDEQWIADSLSLMQSERHRTPYIGIKKVLPGCKLSYDGSVKIASYWELKPRADLSHLKFESAVQLFTERLNQAVRRRVQGYKFIGSELSGGLDSSGVTAFASINLMNEGRSLYALTHILSPETVEFQFPYKDELTFSNALLDSINVAGHLLCSGNDLGILDTVKRSFQIQSGPSQQGFHFYSDVLLKEAANHGIETILSGFGGDEGVSSKAPGFFKEMKISGNKERFRNELLLRYSKNGLGPFQSYLRTLLHYYVTPRISWSRLPGEKRIPSGIEKIFNSIDRRFLDSMQIRNRFREKFVFADEDTLKERLVRQLMHNHIPQRLEYSYLSAKSYGIEYSYPLLDIDLLQLYLDLPAEFKFRNGSGRAIFRESLKGVVSEQIRLREDKSGFAIPSVFARISKDCNQINELILRCRDNNNYHYLDYSYMLSWLNGIKSVSEKTAGRYPGTGAFINAVQMLMLQDMQRSGEFESGIQI